MSLQWLYRTTVRERNLLVVDPIARPLEQRDGVVRQDGRVRGMRVDETLKAARPGRERKDLVADARGVVAHRRDVVTDFGAIACERIAQGVMRRADDGMRRLRREPAREG